MFLILLCIYNKQDGRIELPRISGLSLALSFPCIIANRLDLDA